MDIKTIKTNYGRLPRKYIYKEGCSSLPDLWSSWSDFLIDTHSGISAIISLLAVLASLLAVVVISQSAAVLTYVLFGIGAYFAISIFIGFYGDPVYDGHAATLIGFIASGLSLIASLVCLILGFGDAVWMWIGGVLTVLPMAVAVAFAIYHGKNTYISVGESFKSPFIISYLLLQLIRFVIPTIIYPFYWLTHKITSARKEAKDEEYRAGFIAAAKEIADALEDSAAVGELAEYFTPLCIERLSGIEPPKPKREERVMRFEITVTEDYASLGKARFNFEEAKLESVDSYVELYGLTVALARRLERELAESAASIAEGEKFGLSTLPDPPDSKNIINVRLVIENSAAKKRSIYDTAGEHSEKS